MKLQRNGIDFIFLDRIYRIDEILFAFGKELFRPRPFYPDNPVDLVQFSFNKFLFRSDWTLAASGRAYTKLQLFRQDLSTALEADFQQDFQDFFGLVWRYAVHIVDPVRK